MANLSNKTAWLSTHLLEGSTVGTIESHANAAG
jgi:hypothetical protein